MNERSVTHATFVIERKYAASPARVFAAWSSLEAKNRWASCHENGRILELDFRVGGREVFRGGPPGGPVYTNETRYQDIVPNERIVFSYDLHRDDTRISVSLTTLEFKAEGKGTRLVFTEQGAFLDGHDTAAQREHGTGVGLDRLEAALRDELADA
ncbi:SRPBCC family protein [Polyangium aurulentum]|uniref:SRPBCC family protein n=1 Tax=Polyangium aurulentum TaxID=2567896 RepID=UPI0010ADE223|nr:SRPBCC family protein [Polyangium aurulentum]UQA57291.1 SRPBCC family protein [Polyangium aurulentum]